VALPAVAVEGRFTVIVGGTFLAGRSLLDNRTCALRIDLARQLRFSDETFRTFAARSVEDDSADGVFAASGSEGAGVSTGASVAGLVKRAVFVALANSLIYPNNSYI
jgi:hypothetical protein